MLYYGSAMLWAVPAFTGFDATNLIVYSVLPTLLSATLLIAVGLLSARTRSLVIAKKTIGIAFSRAVAAVGLFWIGLIIMSNLAHP